MSLPQVKLLGGPFTDSELNVLALGTLVMELSQDEQINTTIGQACGGIKITINLDGSGDVVTSPAQYVLPTDQLTPSGASYTVWAYTAEGELAWGPNYNLLCPLGGGTFNVNDWVPNSSGSNSGGNTGGITLQTNGTNNNSQQVLNLTNGTNITITDDGAGEIVIAAAGSSGPRVLGWHGWSYAGQTGVEPTQGFGATPSGIGSYSGNLVELSPTSSTPDMLGFGTSTDAGDISGLVFTIAGSDNDSAFTPGILGVLEIQAKLSSTTATRVWIGAQNGVQKHGENFWKSDTPPYPTVAFRYSTAAGDTYWQCVVTDGSTQVTTATTVTPDTNVHKFSIKFSSPNFLFYIDGTLVATVAITTTTITTSSDLNGFFTVDNVGGVLNKIVYIAYFYWDTNV